jgi:hypothetical protein
VRDRADAPCCRRALPAHRERRLADEGDDLADIERDHGFQILVGVLGDRRAPDQPAGVVDEDVESAECDDDRSDDRLRGTRPGHVTGHQHGLAAGVADVVDNRFGRALAGVVVDRDACAVGAERTRGRGPDAGARAGDQNHLALQIVDQIVLRCRGPTVSANGDNAPPSRTISTLDSRS